MIQTQSCQALKIIQGDTIEYLLSEKQLLLWDWAKQRNLEFVRQDAVFALGFPERTVEAIIKKLVQLKRLNKLGEGKATRYKILED